MHVDAAYRTQRRSWLTMTEQVGALLDEYPGPAAHDATGGGNAMGAFPALAAHDHLQGVTLVGRVRIDLFRHDIGAIERHEIVGDERLGLEALISEYLNDSRQGLNTQFSLADLLRQSVYSRLAGYEDLNDAVRVSADPTFRLIGSPKRWDRGCGADIDVALVRDRAADPRGESRRVEGREPRGACTGRDGDARRPDRARHGFKREPGAWGTGRERV